MWKSKIKKNLKQKSIQIVTLKSESNQNGELWQHLILNDTQLEKCVSPLTTKATPEGFPRSGGQGLSAANAMRYAANTPPPNDKKPKPAEDLENKNGSNQNTVDESLIGKHFHHHM